MASPSSVITGFRVETFESALCKKKVLPDGVIGRLHEHEPTQTIMCGATFVVEGEPLGYACVSVSLGRRKEFFRFPFVQRGLGAVSGGFLSSVDSTPYQGWGTFNAQTALSLCSFYNSTSHEKNHEVMVCFDTQNVASVTTFGRNGKTAINPRVEFDNADWGLYFIPKSSPGKWEPIWNKVESRVVLEVDFSELSKDGATKTVEPEVICSELFTNHSSTTSTNVFNTKTTLRDTHTFVYKGDFEMNSSREWKAKLPLLSDAKTTVEIEASFGPRQSSTTSKTRTIERSLEIALLSMTGCTAISRYTKSVLTANAVLTVQTTYANGATRISEVPAKYTGVSCGKAEIKLEGISCGKIEVRLGSSLVVPIA